MLYDDVPIKPDPVSYTHLPLNSSTATATCPQAENRSSCLLYTSRCVKETADVALLHELFQRYGADFIRGRDIDQQQLLRDSLGISALPHSRDPHPDELDDFAAAGIESVEDIRKRWVDSFYFGSESDDRTVAAAFNDKVNPLGVKINAIWSSDLSLIHI